MQNDVFSLDVNSILKCRKYIAVKLSRLIHCLFFTYQLSSEGKGNNNIVIFDTTELKRRTDYKEYMLNFIGQCIEKRPAQVYTIKYAFDIFGFFKKITFIITQTSRNKNIKELLQLSQLNTLYGQLVGLNLFDKSIVTFCDAHPEDNLISQTLKINRCRTYTLQHGYYTYSPGTINQEVYENFISDYMLCWGPSSVANLIDCGISSSRLIPFGYFKETKLRYHGGNAVFILLNGRHNSQTNFALLALAKRIINDTGMRVYIKKHPDDTNAYQDFEGVEFVGALSEGTKDARLAIISESGVFVDFYMAGFPYLILKSHNLKKEFSSLPNALSSDEIINYITCNSSIKKFSYPELVTLQPDFEKL
ncbi:hypothetical protein [Cronobacter muytjensii]|uniref:hypothetical protein n=1 Tax=Cronobacter muytjensii TaxID=413501 RepID=UPI0013756D87|nr:hypothetical protein [Cronobacter muytjensii]NCH53462.1 hypothetical protein [Cronobacter muytjensii]